MSVSVEPTLQPLTGEQLQYQTAYREDDVREDMPNDDSAQGFWGPNSSYVQAECEETGLWTGNHSSGTWVVNSTGIFSNRWHGTSSDCGLQRMASLLAEKRGQPHSRTMGWLCCVLFLLSHTVHLECLISQWQAMHWQSFSQLRKDETPAVNQSIHTCMITHPSFCTMLYSYDPLLLL